MDLFGGSPSSPEPAPRRALSAAVGVTGFLIGVPIIGIAAVGGFLRGWEAAPVLVQGDNLLQPLLLLASGAVGAVLAALAALAGVAAIALIAFASRHYRTR